MPDSNEWKKRAFKIAAEELPENLKPHAADIAWTHTGYPSFFALQEGETSEDIFRRQIRSYVDGTCNCPDCETRK